MALADSTFGTTQINAVAWGNNTWVAVGGNSSMAAYSTEGRDSRSNNINGITYGSGRWVTGGNSGKTAYSTDGRT